MAAASVREFTFCSVIYIPLSAYKKDDLYEGALILPGRKSGSHDVDDLKMCNHVFI